MDKETVLRNSILEIKSGSHLYGLNTQNSDLDYAGIFMPTKEYVFGFKKCEEVDLSIKDKLETGENSKDAIDRKFYEFRKYIKLAMENNPNILEMIFVNPENIVNINYIGKYLLENSSLFPHVGLTERFIGYAISQKKKMIIKRDNYFKLEEAERKLNEIIEEGGGKLLLPQCEDKFNFLKVFNIKNKTDNHYKVGGRLIPKNMTVKRAKQEIEKIIGESTNRKELIKDKGYDYKFGSHLIRILIEGKELLETGKIVFPLTCKEEILEIKTGKWDINRVLEYSRFLEEEIKKLKKSNALPKKPRYNEIEKLTMEVLEEWILKS